jgi:transposase
VAADRFTNDQKGFGEAVKGLPVNAHCVMEATGPYYLQLACWLHHHGFTVSVVNPLVIRRFAQMRLKRVKTDKADARLIAQYAALEHPAAWQPPEQYLVTLQQLDAIREELVKERTVHTNQLEAFTATGMLEKETKKMLNKTIRQNQKNLQEIDQRIEKIIEQYHQQMLANLVTIPGIAKKTACVLITVTAGFTKFKNYKQLSAYVGMTPRIYESGSSVKGKGRICKLGMSGIRALMYMCACSASRWNKSCKELYDRLVGRGKAKKLALIAVANKLVRQAFAIATQNKPYLIPTL